MNSVVPPQGFIDLLCQPLIRDNNIEEQAGGLTVMIGVIA